MSTESFEYRKVIDYIYKKIKDGSLSVGSKLPTERAIAEELSIGRNSIREALSILHGMGMIERRQGSGNYISKNAGHSISKILLIMITLGSISKNDVCEFRRNMEKSICTLLIEKGISDNQKNKLQVILNEMKSVGGEELASLDKEFHDTLIESTDNMMFITIMEAVAGVYREWIDIVIKRADEDNIRKLLKYHEEIYTGITDRDKEKTIKAVENHYDLIEEML